MTAPQQFPKLAVSACVWRDGKVLLVERAKPPKGMWAFPGGHVELGEKLEEAVTRELMEETGMTADFSGLLGLYDVIRRDPSGAVAFHFVIACFLGLAGPEEPVAASDAAALTWADPSELSRFYLAPNIADAVAKAMQQLNLSESDC